MIIETIQYWLWTGVGLQQSMIITSHYSCKRRLQTKRLVVSATTSAVGHARKCGVRWITATTPVRRTGACSKRLLERGLRRGLERYLLPHQLVRDDHVSKLFFGFSGVKGRRVSVDRLCMPRVSSNPQDGAAFMTCAPR
jgi:hypothetical protein